MPVLVNRTGVLAGKIVTAVAAGYDFSLALCSDGTIASWGRNTNYQLGNNSTTDSSVPVLVDRTGVLSGKTVIAISAGSSYSLVLCADGTLAAWGYNSYGQLGNGTTASSGVPVLVDRTGVLAGKTVTAISISAGGAHSLVLCSDGTLASWGYNSNGRLGNNRTLDSSVPVLVDRTGVLSGKTAVAIAAGGGHGLVQCSDGTLATWGYNSSGQLGNNSTTDSSVPVLVDRTGVLLGKTVASISAGDIHNIVRCSDGTLAAWGSNVGNNSIINSPVPTLVSTAALKSGDRFVAAFSGSRSLAVVASPVPPGATTLAASGITDTSATLNGSVTAGGSADVIFEYGPTSSYGTTVVMTPDATGFSATLTSAALSGLVSGTTYHYRVVAINGGGTATGSDMMFTTSTFASLSNLALSGVTLSPAFAIGTTRYVATVPYSTSSLTVTPVLEHATATVKVNGTSVGSGTVSAPPSLATGSHRIDVVVTAGDGSNTKTYSVTVTRLPEVIAFNALTTVPVMEDDFVATGNAVTFALNFAPPVGTNLTVVRNTGVKPIQGVFSNLAQGQPVNLTYAGVNYSFVANYFGGTGNDLVLHWANLRLMKSLRSTP
ncbi:MAG: cadherin-like beta sandwich domain-containing protein [Verrucomicrobia bacterium]|nr:cadherin-like beta sandwich domain-containing protein [Verrucomicrobiota bacterium]